MTSSPNFYELLQVDRHASKEVIEAAYRSLAKKFHPDVNKSSDAAVIMQQLNLVYSTLSDDNTRAEYDRQLNGEEPSPQTKSSHAEEPKKEEPRARAHEEPSQPIACENCGRVDDTLRAAFFQYVISIVVLSFKRGGGGILCSGCRTDKAIRYTLASVLFGPWGLPWGIFWTIEAILRNLSGGKQPAEVNGPLLRSMGAYFLSVGNKLKAISALEASCE